MKYKWLIILILLAFSALIILENRTTVNASFMSYQININLAVMLLFVLILGLFTGVLLGKGQHRQSQHRNRNGRPTGTRLYIGNLAGNTTDADLEQTFSPFGVVKSVNIIRDRETGNPRGFGFIEMADQASGEAAIAALNNTVLLGQTINVNRARSRRHGGHRRPPQGKRSN